MESIGLYLRPYIVNSTLKGLCRKWAERPIWAYFALWFPIRKESGEWLMEKSSNHAGYHLCHLNIGPAKGFIHDPVMADFVANLDAMNNLAYQSLGFVWHLQVDIYNPDDLAMYGEPGLLFNMSVWDSLGSLFSYVYRSEHAKLFKFRHQWFGEMEGPRYVLWWLPEGEIPTLEDAKRRIKYLGANGASVEAFDFKTVFSPDGSIIPAQNFALPSRMQAAREVVV